MKPATINELKKGLEKSNYTDLIMYCLRLAKFKKENKELLTYLLFQEDDISLYIENVNQEINNSFQEINNTHIYYIKKSIRKILRKINKYIRISGSKQAEAEFLIRFCNNLSALPSVVFRSSQISKIYETQLKKIEDAISALHPDLQYDLRKQLIKPR